MRLPRVKPEHAPHRPSPGTVRIGGEIYGLAAEITDPHGWIWTALNLLDGTRTAAEAIAGLQTHFPSITEADASTVVNELISSGYVEDAAPEAAGGLDSRRRDRHSRDHAFFRHVDLVPRDRGWDAQLRLAEAKVVVLGLGGAGSHAAWALTAAGVGHVHCVDGDVVELSNLSRQVLYDEHDVGQPKVDAAVRRLRKVNSDVTITGERRHIANQDELGELLIGCDVFVLTADEPRGWRDGIRAWANRACAAAKVPWIGGGYAGPLITVGVYGPGGPCFECLWASEEALGSPGTSNTLAREGVIGPSAGIAGQLIAYEVLALITDTTHNRVGYLRGVNLVAPDHLVYVRHPARTGCPVCTPDGASAVS